MASKLPIIAIVGRANVGKSSLFNTILERREAIVAREAGTTRDSIMAKAVIPPELRVKNQESSEESELITPGSESHFWLVDTAGIKDPDDEFEFTIQEQILQAAESADVIWVVVEANIPITEEDRRVAKMALKSKKPVFLVVNKVDKARSKTGIAELGNFVKLGIRTIIHTSTTQGTGIESLLSQLAKIIPTVSQLEDDDRLKIALLGRPNVGKSSLFNSLAKKQQAIVADKAGTTRDVNRSIVRYKGREVEIMDTAGIRRNGRIEVGIEKFSVVRALAAIEQADVCFVLIDATEPSVQLDQKIAGLVKESGKGLVLVISKWDLIKDADGQPDPMSKNWARDRLAAEITQEYNFVPWASLLFTSSETGQNVAKVFELATAIDEERKKRIPTVELNKWLREVVDAHPPAGLKNRLPKLNYMVQEHDNPTPAFKIFSSSTRFIHWSYKRYMERNLRQRFGYDGTAVQLWFIEKHETHKHGNSPTKAPRKNNSRAGLRRPE